MSPFVRRSVLPFRKLWEIFDFLKGQDVSLVIYFHCFNYDINNKYIYSLITIFRPHYRKIQCIRFTITILRRITVWSLWIYLENTTIKKIIYRVFIKCCAFSLLHCGFFLNSVRSQPLSSLTSSGEAYKHWHWGRGRLRPVTIQYLEYII